MATYEINGREIIFAGCDYQSLLTFKPTPRTWLLAWKKHPESALNLGVTCLLTTMYTLEACERPPQLIDDRADRYVWLIENPNHTVLDHIEFWLRTCCGTNYYCRCPYADTLHEEMARITSETEDENWMYQHSQRPQYQKLRKLQRDLVTNCKYIQETPQPCQPTA